MINTLKKSAILLFLLLGLFFSSIGQTTTLNKNDVRSAIQQIGDTVSKHYVFPEKGAAAKAELLSRAKAGRYDTISSWLSFKTTITKELRAIMLDKHMYVLYEPEDIKVLNNEDNKTPEENANYWKNKARKINYGFEKINILPGNVGYLKLSEINFFYEEAIEIFSATAKFLERSDALILDLRGNGGGGGDYGPILESWFLEAGKETLGYKSSGTKVVTYGQTMSYIPAKRRLTSPLYILIDKGTGSAAEALTYILQGHKRAVVIGEPSAGGAHFSDYFTINNYIRVSVSTGTPVAAVTGTNWERVGVQPDIRVTSEQALDLAHSEILKKIAHPDASVKETLKSLHSKLNQKK